MGTGPASRPRRAASRIAGRTPAELLFHCVTQQPAATAWLAADGTQASWRQLGKAAVRAADGFQAEGIQPGDRIVTQLENGWQAAIAALAIQLCDAIESPVDIRCGLRRAERVAADLEAAARIDATNAPRWIPPEPIGINDRSAPVTRQVAAKLESFLQPVRDPNACGLILWTSGTTSAPKGVMLGKAAQVANARGKLAAVPQKPDDRRLSVLPWSHAYARTCDFLTWLASGSQLAAGTGWNAIRACGAMVRPTLINAVPSLIDRLFDSQSDHVVGHTTADLAALGLDRLRVLGCGGAALPRESFTKLAAAGVIPVQGYGLTEAGPVVCSAQVTRYRPGTVGVPIRDTQVRLGEECELQLRGPGVMLGYWRDPEATAARFTEDGWLRTGDVARRDDAGDYRILGRLDEVLVLNNGRKIFPAPLERELVRQSGVEHLVLQVVSRGLQLRTTASAGDEQLQRLSEAYQRLRQSRPELPSCCPVVRDDNRWSVAGGQLTAKGTVRRHAV